METDEVVEHEEEIETEVIGNDEMEIELESANSEEILPDVKPRTNSIPPLRPLTIAPKPAKIPVAVKPVAGQQLFLVQGIFLSYFFFVEN